MKFFQSPLVHKYVILHPFFVPPLIMVFRPCFYSLLNNYYAECRENLSDINKHC